MRFSLFLAAAFCAAGLTLQADHEEVIYDANGRPAGHSLHGEAFDEGPRQKAYLMPGMPKIDFPVSTSAPEAQKFFNQGVGQLHGFWYFEAERSFRQVALLDTNCAMAFWGMAMANINNGKRAKEFIQKAAGMTNHVSRRESLYIESLAKLHGVGKDAPKDSAEQRRQYVKGLEQIIEEFPGDIEAKALLAFKIWDNNGQIRISSHTATDALAREVVAVEPMHPVHHARIHLWNNEADRRALESAARCGQGSPGIAHMWHMPGHTYSALKRYADATWQQEASARVDHAYMIQNRILPDQIHNYAHNNDWLVQNFNYVGRAQEAISLAKNLIELPRHPKYNTIGRPMSPSVASTNSASAANARRQNSAIFGRRRLVETLQMWELWDDAVSVASSAHFEATDVPQEKARRAHLLAVAHFMRGDLAAGDQAVGDFKQAIAEQKELRSRDAAEAEEKAKKEKKPDDQVLKAMTDALQAHASSVKSLEGDLEELRVFRAVAGGNNDEAKELLKEVKGISRHLQSRLYLKLGDNDKAVEAAREHAKSSTNQVQALANYIDVLAQAGKIEEARPHFDYLRGLAAQADLETPVLKRLAPVAARFGEKSDWRARFEPASDVGERPDLDSLGPLRWHPAPAPEWALRDSKNRRISLKDYRGKPLIMVFYLGYGCAHCLEQLNAFAPKTKDFKEAGISLVAVSTDSVEGLEKTFEKSASSEGFQFPILSDKQLEAFKSYGAHDDFENLPLHGTFLIDGEGNIRWQDISFEPFIDVDFLLAESRRLLNLPGNFKVAKAQRPLSPRARSQLGGGKRL